jgi:hypothetical protein
MSDINFCNNCGAPLRICAQCGGGWCKYDGNPTGCDACRRPTMESTQANLIGNAEFVPADDETPEWNKAAELPDGV